MNELDPNGIELNLEDYFIPAPFMKGSGIGLSPILPNSTPDGTFVIITYKSMPISNDDVDLKRVISVCRIVKKRQRTYVSTDNIPQAVLELAKEELISQQQITGTKLFAKPTAVPLIFDFNKDTSPGTSHFITITQPRKANQFSLPFEVSIMTPDSFTRAKTEQAQRLKLSRTK